MRARWKVAGFLILTTILVLGVVAAGEVGEIKRVSADLLQLGNTQTIQQNSIDTDKVFLKVDDNQDEAKIGEVATYTISYKAKQDIKQVRIVAAFGETKTKIYPVYFWDLHDLKAGASGSFSLPIEIKTGESNFAISRATISEMQKTTFFFKEQRKILATVDDVDKIHQ